MVARVTDSQGRHSGLARITAGQTNSCIQRSVHPPYVMSVLTDDGIISLCHDPATTVLSASQYSNRVVRITDSLAVKFGHFVTAQEFRNQQVAQRCLNAGIVNVPTAYRFIQKEDIGYIVMDYVEGDTLELASAKPIAELGKVLGHIHQQPATRPGPLGADQCLGCSGPNMKRWSFRKLMTSNFGSTDVRPAHSTNLTFVVMLYLCAIWISIQETLWWMAAASILLIGPPLGTSLDSLIIYCTSSSRKILAFSTF
ncbi:hypothetical protein BDV96DRAFT_373282 [Lophiotrema nucula]|uniref:Aminoglycoside phosphotransferase domain-containing protein n=1 Tax=Lophiotrema nucula TaxID=690887 RepID=A0A6A5YEH5_9PLEO|nr:hypothetical protein BDV96DRAFT_373282 [Lophiotrema nucula]